MSEVIAEKVIFSVTPEKVEPKRLVTRTPVKVEPKRVVTRTPVKVEPKIVVKKSLRKKESTTSSSCSRSYDDKPIPRYLQGPLSSYHDICKYGFRRPDGAKKSLPMLPFSSGSNEKMKVEKNVNKNESGCRVNRKKTASRIDLSPENPIPRSNSSKNVYRGSTQESSSLKLNAQFNKGSNLPSFHSSGKATDHSSEDSLSIVSTLSLTAADFSASDKHFVANLTEGMRAEPTRVESESTTDIICVDIEAQTEGSSIEPVSTKFMISPPEPKTISTSENIVSSQSNVSADGLIGSKIMTTSSIEKMIFCDENTTSNGARGSSTKKSNLKNNQTESSAVRMQMKNHNSLKTDKHRPAKQAEPLKEVLGGKLKTTLAARSGIPLLKISPAPQSTPSEMLKTRPVTRRSSLPAVCASKDQQEGLSRKLSQTKSLSREDPIKKRQAEKFKSSPSCSSIEVDKKDKDVRESSSIKDTTPLKKTIKSVKHETENVNRLSLKNTQGIPKSKEKMIVVDNNSNNGGAEVPKTGSISQSVKSNLSNVRSLKPKMEGNMAPPPSTVKSKIRLVKLSSKGKITPATEVEKIDLKRIKENLRRHKAYPSGRKEVLEDSGSEIKQVNRADSQKERIVRNSNQAKKKELKIKHSRSPSSRSEEGGSVNRKFSTRSKLANLHTESKVPLKLSILGRTVTSNHNAKRETRIKRLRRRIDSASADGNSGKLPAVVLRHQVQDKKEDQGLFNIVIEETASKLVKTRKSKVKALVGAFETVISLQESKVAPV